MFSSSDENDSMIETEDGILTTKNVQVDYKKLEAKGAKLNLSDDDLEIQHAKKKKKVEFNQPAPPPAKQFDNKSIVSAASKVSRISQRSTASKISIEADRLSVQIQNLGLNEDEINITCQEKAEQHYQRMINKKFKNFLENSEKVRKSNETSERLEISKEELYKMPRYQLIYKNQHLKVLIKKLEKQKKALEQEFVDLSKELDDLQQS